MKTITKTSIYIAIGLMGACKDAPQENRLKADETITYKGEINFHLLKQENDKYKVAFKLKADAEFLWICKDRPAADAQCNDKSDSFVKLNKMTQQGLPKHLYITQDEWTLDDKEVFFEANVIRAQKIADSRKFSFKKKATTPQNPGAAVFSKGTGGKKVDASPQEYAVNGKKVTQYRVWAPDENSENVPHRLVVYLHGDTGSNYGTATMDPRIDASYAAYGQPKNTLDQARDEAGTDAKSFWNQTVFVSILTPTFNGNTGFYTWNTNIENRQKDYNATVVNDIIKEKILKSYNIDLKKIYFVGQSSGAVFLSNTFVPKYAATYSGGAIMLCGGEPVRADLAFTPGADLKSKYNMHFQTTQCELPLKAQCDTTAVLAKDSFAANIKLGAEKYQALFDSKERITYLKEGAGEHCQFPSKSQPKIIRPLIEKWEK
jgi:hypothetical protein